MLCQRIQDGAGRENISVRWHDYLGPMELKKDMSGRKYNQKGFFDVVAEFEAMAKKQREKYRYEEV